MTTEQQTPDGALSRSLADGRAAASHGRTIAHVALIIMMGNVFSRLLGFVRDEVIAILFGASAQTSGYFTALRVQWSIYDLLVSGVISAAFIPVFTLIQDDEREFRRVGSTILTLTGLVMVVAMGALELFTRDIIALLSQGNGAVAATGVMALRLLAPTVVFLGLSGVLTALLYAKGRAVFPAFSPAIFNLGIVVAAVMLAHVLHIESLAVGVVGGAIAMVLLQGYGLRGVGLRPALALGDPRVRSIGRLILPVFLGLIVTQVQVLIDVGLANGTGPRSLSWLNYATRIYQLPLGIVATATSLASLPTLSRLEGDQFRDTLVRGLLMTLLLIVPAAIVCGFLASPLISLAFLHGHQFTVADSRATADALRFYAPGLLFAAVDQLLIFAFYAKNDTKTPVIVGVISILFYLVVAFMTLHPLSYRGLALADSTKQVSHAAILFFLLRHRLGRLRGLEMWGSLGKILVTGLGMGIALWVIAAAVHASTLSGTPQLLLLVAGLGGTATGLYALVLYAWGVEEVALIVHRLRGRFDRGVERGA